MMPIFKYLAPGLVIAAIGAAVFVLRSSPSGPFVYVSDAAASADIPVLLPLSANALSAMAPSNPFGLADPVAQFKERITKKTFGMFITPDISPVADDRFSGYHTGVDAEFTDTTVDIPVSAIADGVVVISKWVTGYGGLVVVRHTVQGIPLFALYGHLNPSSLVAAGASVAKGQQLGILGEDHSTQTDGVRKHLHFALYSGTKVDVRGYVPQKVDLENWLDPLQFF